LPEEKCDVELAPAPPALKASATQAIQ
jgi:hypothetical protein